MRNLSIKPFQKDICTKFTDFDTNKSVGTRHTLLIKNYEVCTPNAWS